MHVGVVGSVTAADTAAVRRNYDEVLHDVSSHDWLVSPWGWHTARRVSEARAPK